MNGSKNNHFLHLPRTQKNYTFSFVCVLQTLESGLAKKIVKSQNMSTRTTLL